jgi:glucose/arabinose dehydrogenase/mono/diheme cytochrome c family protein
VGYKKPFAVTITVIVITFFVTILVQCKSPSSGKDDGSWKAPPEADQVFNPLLNMLEAESHGKELYTLYCQSCHGETGYGDGAAGAGQGQKPANFHDEHVKKQRPGALFWKISNGRGNMPPFEKSLTAEQRWQLVSYIRSFTRKQDSTKRVPPKALRPDITVTHVMKIAPLGVRILKHPLTGELYFTSFEGDVFRFTNLNTKEPGYEKLITFKNHGITRLQGAIFLNNSLFLCGNVDSENKKGTSGRMVRCELLPDTVKTTIVFNTVEYGSNKTIYDHGWNALAISADGKYIYVNSGARTDHGEVQDNGGLYPNARDNALTSKIFRFPADAKDLLLKDDEAALKAAGYIYAEGIRNAYDMDFDGEGNLFAVVNSSDYDNPEDMFWVREGHHYGFPWVMGGVENPQQYPNWKPDPETDKFIPPFSHSWQVKYFHTDSTFPKIPAGLKFSPGVQNTGPDANEYRGHSGEVLDGDITGIPVSTFTPHSSPLGLFFDTKKILSDEFNGDGFVIRYTSGKRGSMMKAFTAEGSDLLHLDLSYNKSTDNYFVKTTRIVDGFIEPTDAIMVGNDVFVIEYGGRGGDMWKITLPSKNKKFK